MMAPAGSQEGKKRECPGCAVEVVPVAGICPICNYEFPRRPPIIIGAAVLLVVALLTPLLLRLLGILGR